MEAMKIDDLNVNVDHNSGIESEKSLQQNVTVQADGVQNEKEGDKAHLEIATSETKIPDAKSALPQQVNLFRFKCKVFNLHERVIQLPTPTLHQIFNIQYSLFH